MRAFISHGTIAAVIAAVILSTSASQPSVAADAAQVDAYPAMAIADAHSYLRSVGIDSGGAVVQVGARNYAGPDCPGSDWNCTAATVVIQIGWGEPYTQNVADCTSPRVGDTCTIIQGGPGDNKAHCFWKYTTPSTPVASETTDQTCAIFQSSTGINGPKTNEAVVVMEIDQNRAATQNARQLASVKQTNTTAGGPNRLQLLEKIKQSSDVTGNVAITQTQNASQVTCVEQSTTTGNNWSQVDQALTQNAQATYLGTLPLGVSAVVQLQNAVDPSLLTMPGTLTGDQVCVFPTGALIPTPFGHTRAGIKQTSAVVSGGTNQSQLNQSHDLDAAANVQPAPPALGNVDQTQGVTVTGGLFGAVVQTSSGISRSQAKQVEDQQVQAQTEGTLTQKQFGPEFCCTEQTGNDENSVAVGQASSQGSNGGLQHSMITGTCATPGECVITHQGKNDHASTSESSPTPIVTSCSSSSEGGSCTTAPPEDEGPPPIN